MKKSKKIHFTKASLGIPYGIFMFAFIVLPILILIFYSFCEKGVFSELTWKFTFQNFADALSLQNLAVIGRSLLIGLISTILCLLIGYPTAYILSNKKYNKSATLVLLFVLPMWINFLLRTLATKALFDFLGLGFGTGAVIFGMVYNFLPFMILPIYTTLCKIDKSLIEASYDLGASESKAFYKVTLPLSFPGILSGVTMVFTPAITTFVISDMLSNNKLALIGNFINMQVGLLNYNVASAMSLIMLVFIGITMVFVNKYGKNNQTSGGGLW